jgi:hypothetical protein
VLRVSASLSTISNTRHGQTLLTVTLGAAFHGATALHGINTMGGNGVAPHALTLRWHRGQMKDTCVQPATSGVMLPLLLAVALALVTLCNAGLWLLLSHAWSLDRSLVSIKHSTASTAARVRAYAAGQGVAGDSFNLLLLNLWVRMD